MEASTTALLSFAACALQHLNGYEVIGDGNLSAPFVILRGHRGICSLSSTKVSLHSIGLYGACYLASCPTEMMTAANPEDEKGQTVFCLFVLLLKVPGGHESPKLHFPRFWSFRFSSLYRLAVAGHALHQSARPAVVAGQSGSTHEQACCWSPWMAWCVGGVKGLRQLYATQCWPSLGLWVQRSPTRAWVNWEPETTGFT